MNSNYSLENIIKKQAILNIGFIGNVGDGKSSAVKALTGAKTQRHSSEKERNCTIKLGYSNAKIWKCDECPEPKCYYSSNSTKTEQKCKCGKECKLCHHFSIVDCPGHHALTTTTMSGRAVMDEVIAVISSFEDISTKKQLKTHLISVKVGNLEPKLILQNKLDLISKTDAINKKEDIIRLFNQLKINVPPIVPISLSRKLNTQWILHYIMTNFKPQLKKNESDDIEFIITRSFDINKGRTNIMDIKGTILGGSLIKGKLKIGDEIEIRPGVIAQTKKKDFICTPIKTKIISLETNNYKVNELYPGGLSGIGTLIDPFYGQKDRMAGQIAGTPGKLPPIYSELQLKLVPIEELSNDYQLKNGDKVKITVSAISVNAETVNVKRNKATFKLLFPICFTESTNNNIIISRVFGGNTDIISMGHFIKGKIV